VRRLALELGSDLLYANGTRAIPYALGAAALGCRPLLFHHHGVLERGPIRLLTRAAGLLADAIVTPSRIAAMPFRTSGRVHLVANGVDLARFRPSPERAGRAGLGVPGSAAVVGTLTRPDRPKGMNDFLALARNVGASLPDAHFVLAGGPVFPHEKAQYAEVVQRATSLGERVTVTGHVDDPASVYNALDVFVHLGGPEGFGLTVLESLACGVPVVAYDWGAVPEVFAGLVTLVPPTDVQAAASAVTHLLADRTLREDYANRGRQAAEQHFGIDAATAQLRAVIESVVAGGRLSQ
jgi:mannosyltransferase